MGTPAVGLVAEEPERGGDVLLDRVDVDDQGGVRMASTLEIPVRSGPLLDCLHPFGQECICLEAVQRAVIDREGDVDHRARFEPAGGIHLDPRLHLADAEDRRLGLIDDDRRRAGSRSRRGSTW